MSLYTLVCIGMVFWVAAGLGLGLLLGKMFKTDEEL